jgi:transposase-like protein
MVKRQKFTSEFKLEALRLMESSGKPAADLARELGVRCNQLYKWKSSWTDAGRKRFADRENALRSVMRWDGLSGSWRRSKRSELS